MITVDDVAEEILLSPAELVDALAAHERRAAALALAVAHVSERADWATEAVTMRAFLRDRCRMSDTDAGNWLRRSRLLNNFGAFADAAVSGALSSSQLGTLEAVSTRKYQPLLREHQRMLVEQLQALDAAETQTATQLWRQRADALLAETEPPVPPSRSLSMSRAGDLALLGRFTLDDAGATELEQAIGTALTYDGTGETRTLPQRQGDALFDIAAFYNKNHDRSGTSRHLPHVGISINANTLDDAPEGVNDDDQRLLTPACTDRYLCDCVIHTMLRDAHGAPQAFGRSRYVVPRALFRQIAARDGGCRFPGCHRNVRHCDAHHIRYWRRNGTTEYANLTLLCARHHHLVHQLDLQLKLLPNGELHVTWPDGRERSSQPRGAPPTR